MVNVRFVHLTGAEVAWFAPICNVSECPTTA